jgi:hypothetical protein
VLSISGVANDARLDALNIISYWQSAIAAAEYPIESNDCTHKHKNNATLIFNHLSNLAMLFRWLFSAYFSLLRHAHFQPRRVTPRVSHVPAQLADSAIITEYQT